MLKRVAKVATLPLVIAIGAAAIWHFRSVHAAAVVAWWFAIGFAWRFGLRKTIEFTILLFVPSKHRRWIRNKKLTLTRELEALWRLIKMDWRSLTPSGRIVAAIPFALVCIIIIVLIYVLGWWRGIVTLAQRGYALLGEVIKRRIIPILGRFATGRMLLRIAPITLVFMGPIFYRWEPVVRRFFRWRIARFAVRRRQAVLRKLRAMPHLSNHNSWT